MKCQILFSGDNKKTITNLLSAEFAQRVVKFKDLPHQQSVMRLHFLSEWNETRGNKFIIRCKSGVTCRYS